MTVAPGSTLLKTARSLVEAATARDVMFATAESCTGGLIAATLTEIAGSSAVVDRGFVTYSNEAKTEMLGVDTSLIAIHGAVSAEVAKAMAEGALARSKADLALSVTGVAGPGGGSPEKPIGLVFSAIAAAGRDSVVFEDRFGKLERRAIRMQTVANALGRLLQTL